MSLEAIGTIVAILTALASVGVFVFSLGKRDAKIEQLERLLSDYQTRNDKRLEELYVSRNQMAVEIVEVTASVKAICDRLQRIEPMLDELIQRMGKV